MANRKNNILSKIIVIFIIAAAGMLYYSFYVYERETPEFTSYNTKSSGLKGLYLLAGRMGYQVKRYNMPAKFLDEKAAMVIYNPQEEWFNDEAEHKSLEEWIGEGNDIIYLCYQSEPDIYWLEDYILNERKEYDIQNLGEVSIHKYTTSGGHVIVLQSRSGFDNESLRNTPDNGIAFIHALEKTDKDRIIFNEYYHGIQIPAPGPWQLIGKEGQLLLMQIILAAVLLSISVWMPFGKPRKVFTISHRMENESVLALSQIYFRTKSHSLVLQNYLEKVRDNLTRYLGLNPGVGWEELLSRTASCRRLEKLAAGQVLEACLKFIQEGKRDKKVLAVLVKNLEQIEKVITGIG